MSDLCVNKRRSSLNSAAWLVTFGVPVLIWFLPLQIDPLLQRYFAVTLWGLLSWITVVIPVEATGLTIPILYMMCGIVPAEVAFAPWQNAMVWNTIAIILVGTACDKSGISKRMAYSVLLKMNCSLRGLIWGFAAVGMLLAFLISDSFSRMIIFVTIAMGICRALNIPFKSKEASALGLAAFFGMSGPSIGIYTASNALLINSVYRDISGQALTYFPWLLHNFLPGVAWTVLSVLCVLKVLRIGKDDAQFDARDVLQAQKNELGHVSPREIMVLVVLVLIVLNYIFMDRFGIDPLLVPALLIPLYFLPKIGILTKDDFDISDAKVLFVVTGAIAVGSVAGSIGLVDIIVEKIGPFLTSSPFVMVFGTFIIGSLANFVLTPIAIVFTLTESFTRMAMSAGINTLPVMYALNFATDIYIFPYEFAIFLVCFSFGLIHYRDLIKVMIWRVICGFGIFLVICVPLWKLCGLM